MIDKKWTIIDGAVSEKIQFEWSSPNQYDEKSKVKKNINDKLIIILDYGRDELKRLKTEVEAKESIDPHTEVLGFQIAETIEKTCTQIMELLEEFGIDKPKEYLSGLMKHEFLELSVWSWDSAMHAWKKPNWYAGDGNLMNKICNKSNQLIGLDNEKEETNYEKLVNLSFLNYPTAESVRQRAKSLFEVLKGLDDWSKVMNFACWPAIEVQWFLEASEKDIEFYLLDNDTEMLKYLKEQDMGERVQIIEADALWIKSEGLKNASWWGELDLIYSSWLYDYLRVTTAKRITKQLFDQLKVWWKLMIGNYLDEPNTIRDEKNHPDRQKFVMKNVLDWSLMYRTKEEIEEFLYKLDDGTYEYTVSSEYFATEPGKEKHCIWFLIVEKIK